MNLLAQRDAIDKLHCDVVRALVFTNLEDLRYVGVTE